MRECDGATTKSDRCLKSRPLDTQIFQVPSYLISEPAIISLFRHHFSPLVFVNFGMRRRAVYSLSRQISGILLPTKSARSLRYAPMPAINPSRGRDAAIFGSGPTTKRQKLTGPLIGTHKQVYSLVKESPCLTICSGH